MMRMELDELEDELSCLLEEEVEAVLAQALSGHPDEARRIGLRKGWPESVVHDLLETLQDAFASDAPMPPDADPEQFLEFARGTTDDAARQGHWATQAWELWSHRTGTISQCIALARWLVQQCQGHRLQPQELLLDGLRKHVESNPDGSYLLRWGNLSWVVPGYAFQQSEVLGPRGGDSVPIGLLDQAWFLKPIEQD